MIYVIFAMLSHGARLALLRALSGGWRARLSSVLTVLLLVLGLNAFPASAAVNLQISVDPGTSATFGVPSKTSSLTFSLKNTGTTAVSFSSGVANFTIQLPPHMGVSLFTPSASYIVCQYLSGSAATTGVVVRCSPSVSSLAAGAQVTFSTYAFADAGAIGVAGTVRAAVDASGGNTLVDPSNCTSTGSPNAGCFVGALAAPYSAGTAIMGMRVGAPSTTVVGQAAQFSLDMAPYLLAGGNTSVTVNSYLDFYFQLPPYYTYGSISAKSGRPNSGLGHSCSLFGGTAATGLLYRCYNGQNSTSVTLSNSSASGAAGWLVIATPTRFAGGQMRASTPPVPGGQYADGGFGGAGSYADPQACAADDVVLGCGFGGSVPGGPNLGLALSNPASLSVGATTPYTLTLSNRGTVVTGSTLILYDQLPANVQYSAASPAATGSVTANGVSCSASGLVTSGQLLTCTVTLPSGLGASQSTDLTLSVTPLAAASGASTTNKAAVDPTGNNAAQTPSTCTSTDAPNPGCAVASAITVGNGVSLQLAKSNPPALVTGTAAAYGLVVSNVGTGASGTSLVLYDQLPANFVYASASNATPSGGTALSGVSCANYSGSLAAGWLVRCTLTLPAGGLAAGSSAGITFNATPQAAATFAFSWREGGLTRVLDNRALKQAVSARSANQWTALSDVSCTTVTSGAQAGSCSVTLTSTQAGWFTVLSQVGGVTVGNPSGGQVAAQFVAGPAVAANSVITISPGTRQADGVDTHTVTITARDAFDNVQADVSTLFTFSPPAAGASLSASSCSTATAGANAGSCSVTLKATTAGTYAVAGGMGGQPVGSPVQGQFIAPTAGGVTAVPSLSEWACVGLVLGLGWLGLASGGLNRRSGRQPARHDCGRCSWPGTWPGRHGG